MSAIEITKQELPLVIIADDDPAMRLMLCGAMESEGYRILEAGNGLEAVGLSEQHRPSLILMDAIMPGMDGFEACRQIQQFPEANRPLILMITSLNDDESVEMAFSAGAYDFVTKPIHWAVLKQRVKHILKMKSADHQIQQAQKMEAIGQMTGGIAHDFNNILTSMLGYTELIQYLGKEIENNQKLNSYLCEIQTAGNRAKSLVEQMLAFSRKDIGESKVINPASVVNEAIKLLKSTIPSSIEIRTQNELGDQAIKVDPVQLHQSIMNLVLNSRDALPGKGQINVCMTANKTKDICDSCHSEFDGMFVEISVKDSGEGIPQEYLSRVFDPFFTTKEVGKGSGMGLSMVHGIAHGAGGHLKIQSSPESGTVIRLLMPVALENLDSDVEQDAANIPDQMNLSGRVLVVDDEQTVANYISELLNRYGIEVCTFSNSVDALSHFKNNPLSYDLLITDQVMPNLVGTELAKAIRIQRPDMPILLCTGYCENIDEISVKEMGINRFLSKPINTDQLLDFLNKILCKQRLSA